MIDVVDREDADPTRALCWHTLSGPAAVPAAACSRTGGPATWWQYPVTVSGPTLGIVERASAGPAALIRVVAEWGCADYGQSPVTAALHVILISVQTRRSLRGRRIERISKVLDLAVTRL